MRVERKSPGRAALTAAAKELDKTKTKIGWFESAKYEDGTPVAGVAAVQEFGNAAGTIPSRSFFRSTIAEHQKDWKKSTEDLTRAAAQGKIAPKDVMPALGLAAEGQVRKTIAAIDSPPLKEATVEARKRRLADGGAGATKGIEKPLVDTGVMLNTLTSTTEKK